MEPLTANAPPLDYSFKELKTCMEIETEESRSGGPRKASAPGAERTAEVDGGELQDGSSQPALLATSGGLGASGRGAVQVRSATTPHFKRVIRKVAMAVKLDNNFIESVQDLPQALEFVMDDPLRNLMWIDLSFNQLSKIEPALLKFQNLKALYLHGNLFSVLSSAEKLRKLPKLISLTMNGNPIENSPCYRRFVVGCCQHLRTLDHSTITSDELDSSRAWFEEHLRRADVKKREREDAMAALNEQATVLLPDDALREGFVIYKF